MRRHVGSLAAVLSLLLCVASAVLWVRSIWRIDSLTLNAPYHVTSLIGGGERLCVLRLALDFGVGDLDAIPHNEPVAAWSVSHERFDAVEEWYDIMGWAGSGDVGTWHGFELCRHGHPPMYNSESPPMADGWEIGVPYWSVVAAFGVCPAISLSRSAKRRRRVRLGLCPVCAYNLTGNTSGVCPECGRSVGRLTGRTA